MLKRTTQALLAAAKARKGYKPALRSKLAANAKNRTASGRASLKKAIIAEGSRRMVEAHNKKQS